MMLLLKMCAATFIVLLVVSPNKVDPQKVGTLSDWRVFLLYSQVLISKETPAGQVVTLRTRKCM